MQPPAPASFSNYGDFATIKTDMTTKEMIEVMQASLEGKPIQVRIGLGWMDTDTPEWNWYDMDYRVKPEPKYRPFNSAGEVMEAIKEKGDWINHNGRYYRIIEMTDKGLSKGSDRALWSWNELLSCCTFRDGTPFGKLEE